ncbi:MAG: hypothetical protein J6C52_02070, partial [Clostridia bacterium]|nr:hypothetical protein [Clostridia bacterium]
MKRIGISRRAHAGAILEIVLVMLLAIVLFFWILKDTLSYGFNPAPLALNIFGELAKSTLYLMGTGILLIPPVFGGIFFSLRRFFKRSTITSLRDNQ